MPNKMKKFFKTLFLLLVLLLLGIICYKYQELKKEGRLDEIFASTKKEIVYTNSIDPYEANKKTSKEESNKKDDSNENKFVLEKKNYEGHYNEFNFDNVLLLYEGNQSAKNTREALERLIVDADDSLYTKPTVEFRNFDSLSKTKITADNLEEYKSVLNEAKKSIKDEIYNFYFEYSSFNAIVDTIIITKK